MATNLAVSTNFGSLETYVYPTGYDSTKLGLGPLMVQANDAGNEGKWVGPIPTNVMRPVEQAAAMPALYMDAIAWSPTIDWVVVGDGAAVAANRRFGLYYFNRANRTNPWSFQGVITSTGPGGNMTHKGHAVSYEKYITGTVYISNGATTLNGVGTTWLDDRMWQGSRIAIGSADPTVATTWYEISAINSNTQITLTQAYLGSTILVGGAVPYVIEDFRILYATTNATVTNGGVFMLAGLRPEIFVNSVAGTTIAMATTTDKLRLCYWMSDGTALNQATNQTIGGIAIDSKVDWTHQNVYACDMTALNSRFQVNNFRAAPSSLVGGRDQYTTVDGSRQFILNTGLQAVASAVATTNNLILCTPGAGGGPRSGIKTLFWVTAGHIYSAAVANLTYGSTGFQSGCAVEKPPGTVSTFAATGALTSILYSYMADRFLISTTSATANKHYWTQYREDVGQWDRIILGDTRQINQSLADPTAAIIPTSLTTAVSCAGINGMTYMHSTGLLATNNMMFNCPFAADWEHAAATNCCVVTPAMSTSQFSSFIAGYYNQIGVVGGPLNPSLGRTGTNLGSETGAVRMYYRTTGIADNSGAWNLLDYTGWMASATASTQIQARLEFRVLNTAFPARVTRVCFEGTGSTSIINFQFSQAKTVIASKQFAFRQASALGAATPLYMRIYDAVTNSLLVSDVTSSPTGKWEYATDGTTWIGFSSQGSGATVTFTQSGGGINSVTTTPAAGGTGYPASATINLMVTSGGGTGGIVQATTNGSGVITAFSATQVAAGTGYSNTSGATTSPACPWSTAWDFTNNTTYLRYTPASIADSVDAMPVLGIS